MKDLLKKSISLSIDIGTATKKKAEEIAKDFIKKRKIKSKYARKLAKDILKASLNEKKRIKKVLETEVKRVVERLLKKAETEAKKLKIARKSIKKRKK